MCAVLNKAQKHVFAALEQIRQVLPFPLLGIDSDNGSALINDELVRYCDQEHLTFTRGRAGHKNDNPYVEQKNGSVVRWCIGYARYDTLAQGNQLNTLYAVYRLFVNHFRPVQKLRTKTRVGSKVKRIFDDYQTPYRRVLDSSQIDPKNKRELRAIHAKLDVVKLKRRIDERLEMLIPTKQW